MTASDTFEAGNDSFMTAFRTFGTASGSFEAGNDSFMTAFRTFGTASGSFRLEVARKQLGFEKILITTEGRLTLT